MFRAGNGAVGNDPLGRLNGHNRKVGLSCAFCRSPTAFCLLPTALLLSALVAGGGVGHVAVKVAGQVGVFELDGGMRDAELAG